QAGIDSFLAHEDIEISAEWRLRILEEIEKADMFIAILSKNYYESIWCKQESGIAAFRRMTIIPVSIDESIPKVFFQHLQSSRMSVESPDRGTILAGVAKHDVARAIDAMIKIVSRSSNYRESEANFQLILPYVDRATPAQIVELLKAADENGQ